MNIVIRETKEIKQNDIIEIYKANQWSSAEKPDQLFNALMNSHSLVTAWDNEPIISLPLTNYNEQIDDSFITAKKQIYANEKLVGLGNALSDGFLVVYYPHLIVHPAYQGKGIGKLILDRLQQKYNGFHQQILVADGKAVHFYKKCGFEPAGGTKPMWIYQGDDH